MKIIKKILLVFFGGLILMFLVSIFLPSKYEIERTEKFSCSKDALYQYLINIDNLDNWFYITKELDSTLVYKFAQDSAEVQSSVEWNGDLMGQGVFQYTNLTENEIIEFKISFQNDAVSKNGKISLTTGKDDSTKVVWIDYGENGWNPVNRIFGLFIDGFLGPDMEKSLSKLKNNLDC
ncbi:MAG: hypothetical protein KIT33_06520 [Candidatus Kapabacteria bacterium]|nr:hypothetical protein [Ignavibacteriota bacterium]MCW5884608.1 hypothetical protein [Candidatus Kapabacteria bacterium]